MKKRMRVLLSAMFITGALAFSAEAADEKDFVGTWYLNSMEMEGMEIHPSSMGMEMSLELLEDGTCTLKTSGEEDDNGSWKLDGDKITVGDGNSSLEFVYADQNLTAEEDGMQMIFGREQIEAEPFEVGAVVEKPNLEDFDGTWNAVLMDVFGMQMPPAFGDIEFKLTIENGNGKLYFSEESEILEKELTGTLEGDTLTLKNPEDPEDSELYFDTDVITLRFHDNGILSYSDRDFSEAGKNDTEDEEEIIEFEDADEAALTEEIEEFDTTFAVYFEKE